MIQGPPPSVASLVRFDSDWHGVPHKNMCVKIRDGKAVVQLEGAPDYELYYVPRTYTQAIEVPGSITITTPDAPHFNGVACLGIALKAP